MTEIERFEKLKSMGYTYNPETSDVERNRKVRGYKDEDGYIILGFSQNEKLYRVKAHRYIWWLVYGEIPEQIDHINHITYDNRLENIRNVSHQQNHFNKKIKKGYYKNQGCFKAVIGVDGKKVYLGHYETEAEAREKYLEAKKIYHLI